MRAYARIRASRRTPPLPASVSLRATHGVRAAQVTARVQVRTWLFRLGQPLCDAKRLFQLPHCIPPVHHNCRCLAAPCTVSLTAARTDSVPHLHLPARQRSSAFEDQLCAVDDALRAERVRRAAAEEGAPAPCSAKAAEAVGGGRVQAEQLARVAGEVADEAAW